MAVDKKALRDIYITFLEEDIIRELADIFQIDNRVAMEKYYSSRLSQQISNGDNGIEYLGSKYLANDLIEYEKELFQDC